MTARRSAPCSRQIARPVAFVHRRWSVRSRRCLPVRSAQRHPDAASHCAARVRAQCQGATAETAPTKRDRHLQLIAERGRPPWGWQRASWLQLAVPWWRADIGRYKRVIGDALHSRTKGRQTTEVAIAVASLNRMLGAWGGRSTFASHERWMRRMTSPALLIRATKPRACEPTTGLHRHRNGCRGGPIQPGELGKGAADASNRSMKIRVEFNSRDVSEPKSTMPTRTSPGRPPMPMIAARPCVAVMLYATLVTSYLRKEASSALPSNTETSPSRPSPSY